MYRRTTVKLAYIYMVVNPDSRLSYFQGTATGGASSFNQGSAQGSQSSGIFGNQQSSGTNAVSNQQGGGGLVGVPVGGHGVPVGVGGY